MVQLEPKYKLSRDLVICMRPEQDSGVTTYRESVLTSKLLKNNSQPSFLSPPPSGFNLASLIYIHFLCTWI
jgi:hypothetical protein